VHNCTFAISSLLNWRFSLYSVVNVYLVYLDLTTVTQDPCFPLFTLLFLLHCLFWGGIVFFLTALSKLFIMLNLQKLTLFNCPDLINVSQETSLDEYHWYSGQHILSAAFLRFILIRRVWGASRSACLKVNSWVQICLTISALTVSLSQLGCNVYKWCTL